MKPNRWAIFALALAITVPASAQDAYPAKPVRIIVPFPAGGVADALPRIVGEKLALKWKQPVIIDNQAGASGNIGMEDGARSAPDGYTLVLAPTGNLTVNPTLFPNLRFDTARDFTPVTLLATSPNVLVVNPAVPARTLRQLIAYARRTPTSSTSLRPAPAAGPTWPASCSTSTPASRPCTCPTRASRRR